jgi:phospholipid transport system substrate-binding protein
MQRILMNVTAAMLLCLAATTGAWALTPTETVKSRVDEALQSLGQSASGSVEARRVEIRRVADSLFDFTEMSRRALGRHWADRTAAEREEFVRLFTDLMARSYIGKMDRYAGEAIAYTGERVDGDEASVQSQVVTAKGSRIPVEYRLHRASEGWTA